MNNCGLLAYDEKKALETLMKSAELTNQRMKEVNDKHLDEEVEVRLIGMINLIDTYKDIIVNFSEDQNVISKLVYKTSKEEARFFISPTDTFKFSRRVNSKKTDKMYTELVKLLRKYNVSTDEDTETITISDNGKICCVNQYDHNDYCSYISNYGIQTDIIKFWFNKNPNVIEITINPSGIIVVSNK